MTIYTIAQAKHNLAALLDEARNGGQVQIQDAEGKLYIIRPQHRGTSPLDVEGLDLGIPLDEMLLALQRPAEDR
jgi:hypothetical protein